MRRFILVLSVLVLFGFANSFSVADFIAMELEEDNSLMFVVNCDRYYDEPIEGTACIEYNGTTVEYVIESINRFVRRFNDLRWVTLDFELGSPTMGRLIPTVWEHDSDAVFPHSREFTIVGEEDIFALGIFNMVPMFRHQDGSRYIVIVIWSTRLGD